MKSYSSACELRVLEYVNIFRTEVQIAICSSVLREYETSDDRDTNKCLCTNICTNYFIIIIIISCDAAA